MKRIKVADLFCGAGGSSTGVSQYAESVGRGLELVAVNHWDRAVETHSKNHPRASHHCEDLTTMDPRKAVPSGRLDLLVASPECTHHSVARGGMPVNDQSRASSWCVLRWANSLQIDRIIIENVPEFVSWGPIGANGRPLQSRRGEIFESFVGALKSSGYRVKWSVLNSANYGAATARRRLFLMAWKGRREMPWPNTTHEKRPDGGLFGTLKPWRGAKEIIDWSLLGTSIFNRKRPLAANTLARIEAGLRKYGGKAAEPFLVLLNGGGSQGEGGAKSVDEPCPVVTAGGNHIGLCQPFIVPTNYGERLGQSPRCHSKDSPLPTVVAGGLTHALVQPFIIQANHGADKSADGGHDRRAHSLDDPLSTVTSGGRSHAIIQPFILPHRQFEQMDVDSIDRPLRTVTAANGGCNALVQPFVISAGGPKVGPRSCEEPLNTVLTRDHMAVVRPFLVPYYGACHEADSLDDPARTITTKDRLGVVEPRSGQKLDILLRMLQPHELSAAMGFPAGYQITGNREEQVRQIGNAVEVNQARALVASFLGGM